METQIVTISVKTQGEVCELSTEEIKDWYKTNIAKLFNFFLFVFFFYIFFCFFILLCFFINFCYFFLFFFIFFVL